MLLFTTCPPTSWRQWQVVIFTSRLLLQPSRQGGSSAHNQPVIRVFLEQTVHAETTVGTLLPRRFFWVSRNRSRQLLHVA